MAETARVLAVNLSLRKGTIKEPVASGVLGPEGLEGDAHAGPWHRQVSLLARESVVRFEAEAGRAIAPGEFAENLTTEGLDLAGLALLDRVEVGEAVLEVTQIGKRCHGDECAIYREVGRCVMPKEGVFTRVIAGGEVRPGTPVVHRPRPLKFQVVTLSDRAYAGAYEDRSGPLVARRLEEHFAPLRWHQEIATVLLPDDRDQLRALLSAARYEGVDAVITTGGTGVGPRDFTPEVTEAWCEKLIPGVMEAIRAKYGATHPNALLSRGVAGVSGRTLVYNLPGSVRAAGEYMDEILVTLEHLVTMVHGLGHA